ncbi:hypothetical protein NKH77_03170 [Streptomyces sp. M19]
MYAGTGTGAPDDDLWRRRVAAVAASLRTDEPRVAASLAFQGLAARLWSSRSPRPPSPGGYPPSPPTACGGTRRARRPTTCGCRAPGRGTHTGDHPAGVLRAAVLDAHLTPLHRATVRACRISGGCCGQRGLRAGRFAGRAARVVPRARQAGRRGARLGAHPRPDRRRATGRYGHLARAALPAGQLLPVLPGAGRRTVRRLRPAPAGTRGLNAGPGDRRDPRLRSTRRRSQRAG